MHIRPRILIGCLWLVLLTLPSAQSADEPASPTEVRRVVVKLLRKQSLAETEIERQAALVELCDAYAAIRIHPKYEESELLQGESVRIRRRLISESDRLSDRLRRANVIPPATLNAEVEQAIQAAYSAEQTDAPSPKGPGGAAVNDEGWALVELIQRTVHPDFWESTGGPGSIRYFAIKRVLVVRATTQVHEDIVALLRQL